MKTILNSAQTRLVSMLTAVLFLAVFSAHAQEEGFRPYAFFGLQGGAQTTLTDYNNWKLITPTTSFSVGVHFTPVLGARIHANGFWNKGGVCRDGIDETYKYNYATADMDLMINMVNLFSKRSYSPVNLYLIGGLGINYAWNVEDVPVLNQYLMASNSKRHQSHNFRVGTMFDVSVAPNWSVNLEVAANALSDRFNSKFSGRDDWQLTAQLGVAYKFAKFSKKKKEVVVEPEEVWETRIDTIWYDDVVSTPKAENGTATWNVFYGIRESNFKADEQLKLIGAFLKDHRDCKIDVKSYADVGTGNPKINMEYSKQRCEKAVKALTDAGVPASAITSKYFGDTQQPFADNDKNRVSIIVATGLKDVSQKETVKKFRTKEVRYRVK